MENYLYFFYVLFFYILGMLKCCIFLRVCQKIVKNAFLKMSVSLKAFLDLGSRAGASPRERTISNSGVKDEVERNERKRLEQQGPTAPGLGKQRL